MIREISLVVCLTLALVGCSDGGGSPSSTNVIITQPDPTISVSGGGVKGPLINANAALYALDITAVDLKGPLISSGGTNGAAALLGITIPSGALGSFLLEITSDDDTLDLTSGAAPILSTYRSVVSVTDIRAGNVFATPVTTLTLELAKQSAPFASEAAFTDAMNLSARQVISTLGFGLDAATNPSTSNPLVTAADTSDEQQAKVLAYRTAIEGMAAILNLMAIEIANTGGTASVDEVLAAVALDLSDGVIDGQSTAGAIDSLARIADIGAVVATDPALLMIPGTNKPITQVADVLVSETATTGVTVVTDAISTGRVVVTPTAAKSRPDIDGDGVPDKEDAFPEDPTETADTDGDGTGNNSDTDDDGDGVADTDDAFPLVAGESVDTDGDGIGNNADTDDDNDGVLDADDAFALDASETVDTDGDGIGNNADTDDDGDGTEDVADAFPLNGSETLDTDGDGTGNNADTDDDNDGVADADDKLPLDPRASIATTTSIGPEGGSITSPDGLMTLNFPPNAVSQVTSIAIGTPTAASTAEFNSDAFAIEGHYLMEPDGLQFAEPVEMVWTIPPGSAKPGRPRLVSTVSNGVFEPAEGRVITNPSVGTVTASIRHFSDLFIDGVDGLLVINQPSAAVGDKLQWEYVYDLQLDPQVLSADVDYRTEGAALIDDSGVPTKVIPPELLVGEGIISPPAHDEVIFCEFREKGNGEEDRLECAPPNMGKISATCLDGSTEGLRSRIGFNFEFEYSGLDVFGGLAGGRAGQIRVEADGFCKKSVVITEPTFISIGNDIERITEAPEGFTISACSSQSQPFHVVVSNTRTSVINTAGSCSQDLNSEANSNAIFGALALFLDSVQRLFQYGESGVFIRPLIDGGFGQLSDFTNTTTDIQHRVNDDGSRITNQAYSVNNRGQVKLRTLLADESNTSEDAFNAVGLTGRTFISYAPITSNTGVGVSSGASSTAFFVDIAGNKATEIGSVGNNALGITCERLACDANATSCSVTNNETVGCVVTAFDSEEMYSLFATDILTNVNLPTFNRTVPVTGIKTASPYVRSNAQGQLVIATVNTNEAGKVRLAIQNSSGTEVQAVEFFLPDFNSVTKFSGVGTSIVMMEPSAEYPNGAVRIGVDNPNGSDDGILTIPVTETLLGTSPVPFFGAPFSQ